MLCVTVVELWSRDTLVAGLDVGVGDRGVLYHDGRRGHVEVVRGERGSVVGGPVGIEGGWTVLVFLCVTGGEGLVTRGFPGLLLPAVRTFGLD